VIPVAGIAAVSKPAGMTSFAALSPLKKKLSSGRVGHAGTLDRFATGLLIVLAGPYSRLSSHFTALDKTYRATVLFGEETATLDPEGKVVAEAPPPTREALEAVLPGFRGPIMQAPPAYSALHLGGERAYEKALRGESFEMKERPVTIHDLDLLSYDGRQAGFYVRCSSGSYIRSLARDIALAAGSRAHLVALVRESIGPISLAEAVGPEAFDAARDLRVLDHGLALALGLRPRILAPAAERRFFNGGALAAVDFQDALPGGSGGEGESAVFLANGSFVGVVVESQGTFRYRFVIREEG
jgi:tRNA pseudouridine55 synthase